LRVLQPSSGDHLDGAPPCRGREAATDEQSESSDGRKNETSVLKERLDLLREISRRAIQSYGGKIHVFEIRKLIKWAKFHVKKSDNASKVVLVKSMIGVL